MKQIELNNKTYLIVDVPDDAFEFKTEYEDKYTTLYVKLKSKPDNNPYSEIQTFEDWHQQECILETSRSKGTPDIKIISTLSNLSEEFCASVVEKVTLEDARNERRNGTGEIKHYFENYLDEQVPCSTAIKSFISKLEAEGIDINQEQLIIEIL